MESLGNSSDSPFMGESAAYAAEAHLDGVVADPHGLGYMTELEGVYSRFHRGEIDQETAYELAENLEKLYSPKN